MLPDTEIGEDGCSDFPIQNYYQRLLHLQREYKKNEALEERQRAWVLSSWQIVVNRYPGIGETVVASTPHMASKAF